MSTSLPTHVRFQTVAAAWLPTAQSVAWRAPLGATALAATIILQQRLAHPSADVTTFVQRAQLIAAIAAAAAATTLDDPAATLVETSPTTAAWRAGLRLSHAIATWSTTWALTLVLIATAPGHLPITELTLQAAALLAVAVGAAAIRGPAAGSAAVGMVVFSALLMPERWSLLADSTAAHGRLGLLAAGGIGAFAWAYRDPARHHAAPWRRPPWKADRDQAPRQGSTTMSPDSTPTDVCQS